jgi:hypothetical protein
VHTLTILKGQDRHLSFFALKALKFIYSIAPSRTNKKSYCRWIVNYRFTDNRPYLPSVAAKRATDILLIHQPNDGYALTKPRCEGSQDVLSSWKIEYGVRCT